jgi:H+-transporting ATPase
VVCSKGGHAWSPGIIAGLLVFNVAIGLHQESRAQATFAALRSWLALTASVRRDGA